MMPSYLSESLKVYVPARQLRFSADQTTLIVPNRNLKSGGYQSFYYLGPRLGLISHKRLEKRLSLTFLKAC